LKEAAKISIKKQQLTTIISKDNLLV